MGKITKKVGSCMCASPSAPPEEEMSDRQLAVVAMDKAIEAFNACLSSQGVDPSFFALRITCWLLATTDFSPLEKIEIDTRSSADGKYHEE